ncbi:MAG: methyl-accepting chemotaxis protein [Nitriliruptoraceae bacterium]
MPPSTSMDRFLTKVIGQHAMWKLTLHRAAAGEPVDLDPALARRDDHCDLGRWLRDGAVGVLGAEERRVLTDVHATFHRVAAAALEQALTGHHAQARRALEPGSEFLAISTDLVERLHQRRDRRYDVSQLADPGVVSRQVSGTMIEAGSQAQLTLEGAQEVAEHATAVAAATEEQATAIQEVAARAAESVEIAQRATTGASEAVDTLQELTASTDRVEEVLVLIDRIARQTHLLALNATIEAARAGSAGRGFSVVASEVKKLATEVSNATREVGDIVSGVQRHGAGANDRVSAILADLTDVLGAQNSIASAVEEQRAVAADVAERVALVASEMTEISDNAACIASATEAGVALSVWLEGRVAHRENAA